MEKMIALVLAVAVLMPLVAGTGTMINPELCAQVTQQGIKIIFVHVLSPDISRHFYILLCAN